jgi:hypothetical protein
MGEYAQYNGQEIKIGTCESMYYLRADQAHLVTPLPGNVDPVRDRDGIRFRFPFPDEDQIAPGEFEDYERALVVAGITAPDIEHYTRQFKADGGYLVSLPCPEAGDRGVLTLASGRESAYRVHRNGWEFGAGVVALIQQRYWEGRLVAVCKCVACGAAYRMPELPDAQPLIDALHAMAAKAAGDGDEPGAVRLRTIADRVAAGYAVTAGASALTAV